MRGARVDEDVSPAASVVVPTYGRPDHLERLLDTLGTVEEPGGPFEVIVVDNGSTDDTTERVEARVARSTYPLRPLRIEVNQGPARARNVGWRAARAPIVAFTDDDCVPEPGWLAAGVKHLEERPEVGVVQGTTAPPRPVHRPKRLHTVIRTINGPTPHFEACNIFYRRDALAQGGGFDEELGWWGEDAAAGWRVVEAGWQRSFEPSAIVYHDVEHRGFRWHLDHALLERNLVYLAARHPGFRREYFWRPWAVYPESAALVLAVLGLAGSARWRPMALAAVPYLSLYRHWAPHPKMYPTALKLMVHDAWRCAGHARGSVENRVFVL